MDTKYPTTRKDAKAQKASHYFTGLPCVRGHIALRKTKGYCVECVKEDAAKAYATRLDYFRAYNRREDIKERRHEWYMAHRDITIARATARPTEVKRQYRKAWKLANPDAAKAHTKSRRRKHREATPLWLSARQKRDMRELYRIASVTTKATGTKYVVDHIIPLQGETVCGLHVPWNLRVIPQKENAEKHNTLPPSEEYLAFPDGVGYTKP